MRGVFVAEEDNFKNYYIDNIFDAIWQDGLNMNDENIIQKALQIYEDKSLLKINNNPESSVIGANVIYTDVWSSMGEENQKEEKDKDFLGFSINKNLVSKADKDAIVLHCLPAYRDKEITDEIIESNKSRIFEQAENRLHAQQALLACLFS